MSEFKDKLEELLQRWGSWDDWEEEAVLQPHSVTVPASSKGFIQIETYEARVGNVKVQYQRFSDYLSEKVFKEVVFMDEQDKSTSGVDFGIEDDQIKIYKVNPHDPTLRFYEDKEFLVYGSDFFVTLDAYLETRQEAWQITRISTNQSDE